MELSINTPALLFPAVSLLMLAYTNRFLALASLIRKLHGEHGDDHDALVIAQIGNLRQRIYLIRNMQALGVIALLGCALCMFLLFQGWQRGAQWIFGGSLILFISSLLLSIREIWISVDALELQLSDLEKDKK
jgi:hypothetical protein